VLAVRRLRPAAALGADVREGFRGARPILDGTTVVGAEATSPSGEIRRIRARVLVDATGRDALFTRTSKSRLPGLDMTAIFTHIEGGFRNTGLDEGQIEITILAGKNRDGSTPGWAWFIPFRDGRSSVGFVLSSEVLGARVRDAGAPAGERLEAIFTAEVERSPWMRRLIGDAPRIAPVRAAADYSFRVETHAGDGWLAVGDAAGFIDPLFSTGAHLAMGGGDRAAAVIDAALAAGDVRAARFAGYAREMRAAADLVLGAVPSLYRC